MGLWLRKYIALMVRLQTAGKVWYLWLPSLFVILMIRDSSCSRCRITCCNKVGVAGHFKLVMLAVFVTATLCVGSGRLWLYSDSSRMQHVCRRVSAARDWWFSVDATEGGPPHDDDECQTWPSTQDLLTSHLSKRITHNPFKLVSCTIVICSKL